MVGVDADAPDSGLIERNPHGPVVGVELPHGERVAAFRPADAVPLASFSHPQRLHLD